MREMLSSFTFHGNAEVRGPGVYGVTPLAFVVVVAEEFEDDEETLEFAGKAALTLILRKDTDLMRFGHSEIDPRWN